nr:unnamed protein product [Callosobruchus chinensis]
MSRYFVLFAVISTMDAVEVVRRPMYHYRYETEDMMKAGSKHIPVHGYHVMEGGYFPEESGQIGHHVGMPSFMGSPGFGKLYTTPIGLEGMHQGFGAPHHSMHYSHPGIVGYQKEIGGEEEAKEEFNKGGKKYEGEHFEKAQGKKADEVHKGEEGYVKAAEGSKAEKGDNGYVKEEKAAKEAHEKEKEYHGGEHYKKEGETAEKKEAKQGHKKGHKVKGFKKSHHLDETGKTEEFFDESHDEGDNFEFKGHKGNYGEGAGSSFKGGNEEKKYNSEEAKKEGHYNQEHASEHKKGNSGEHGAKEFKGSDAAYSLSKGGDEHSLLGNQESSKFYKSQPFIDKLIETNENIDLINCTYKLHTNRRDIADRFTCLDEDKNRVEQTTWLLGSEDIELPKLLITAFTTISRFNSPVRSHITNQLKHCSYFPGINTKIALTVVSIGPYTFHTTMFRLICSFGLLSQLVTSKYISPELGLGGAGEFHHPSEFQQHDFSHGIGKITQYGGYGGLGEEPKFEGVSKVFELGPGEIDIPKAAGLGFGYPIGFDGGFGHHGPQIHIPQQPIHIPQQPIHIPQQPIHIPHHQPIHVQPVFIKQQPIGGGELEKSQFSEAQKKFAEEQFQKKHGSSGDKTSAGDSGYFIGKIQQAGAKGGKGYFQEAEGGNEHFQKGKHYHGGEKVEKEGETGGKHHAKTGHKKGHSVKGFKKSHHLDENGKEEQFYDQAHNEGGNYEFGGHNGKFGHLSGASYKGGEEGGKFAFGKKGKEGFYENSAANKKEHAGQDKYSGDKFAENAAAYGFEKDFSSHGGEGESESSKSFEKSPYFHH